jgi:hypothetical protein
MIQLFGMALPGAMGDVAPLQADALAARMAAAAASVERGVPAAVSADLRQDARHFLEARRRGELRLPRGAAARACDEHARTLLRLTVDAPPLPPTSAQRLVA